MKRPALWLGTLALACFSLHARERIEGAWEMSCITPANSIDNTDPNGMANSKWVFDGNGHVEVLNPDQAAGGSDNIATYSINDGDVQIIAKDGSRRYLRDVQFPTSQTMRIRRQSGGYTQFRRIPSAATLLEPRSLQRVVDGPIKPGHECDDNTKYDQRDYASLPLKERLQGTWEVIMYRNLSPRGVPPYGFNNDLYVIGAESLTVHFADGRDDHNFTYTLQDGVMRTDDLIMTPSFNQWSQLILTNDGGGQVYLKRLSRSTSKPFPKLTLKVVWSDITED